MKDSGSNKHSLPQFVYNKQFQENGLLTFRVC